MAQLTPRHKMSEQHTPPTGSQAQGGLDEVEASTPQEKSTHEPARLMSLPRLAQDARALWRERLVVICVATLILLPMLGSFGLWDPWETHYGEVARTITERNDWISTWWGSTWTDANGHREGEYFFSKPILLMWMMAAGMSVFGVNEIGIRIGVCLVGILGVVSIFAMGRSVFGRRAGLIMAGVTVTAPFYYMLSRQAQTDMPFVGLMTVGMCYFMMAAFGKDRHEPADKLSYGLVGAWSALLIVPQLNLLLVGLARWRGTPSSVLASLSQRPLLVVSLGWGLLILSALVWAAGLWLGRRAALSAEPSKLPKRLVLGSLIGCWGVLLVALVVGMVTGAKASMDLYAWFAWGPTQAAIYATCFVVAIHLTIVRPSLERRRLYLLLFYLFIGLATLAKGLLGFMLPGAILFFYILLTREWRMLRQVELGRGTLLFIAVTFPWYAAMLIRHTTGFWDRFFVHDHFKRLASGVHAVDEGSFEHFMRWLGYGLFPWSGLVPAALARFFVTPGRLKINDDKSRAMLLLLLWAVISFALFTLSSTKFHHYIFPVLPALAMLVGVALDEVLDEERPAPWPMFVLGLGLAGLIGWDIGADPQSLKNLFTYKYDRYWFNPSWNTVFRWTLLGIAIPALMGFGMMMFRARRVRQAGLVLSFIACTVFAYFNLNTYMSWYSYDWSQREIWQTYFALCTKTEAPPGADKRKTYCKEPAIAYKLNWRGETFYTHNQVIPIRDDDDFTHFLAENKGQPFYSIIELPRYRGEFNQKLPGEMRGQACLVYNANMRFNLVKLPCAKDDPLRLDEKLTQQIRTAKPIDGVPYVEPAPAVP